MADSADSSAPAGAGPAAVPAAGPAAAVPAASPAVASPAVASPAVAAGPVSRKRPRADSPASDRVVRALVYVPKHIQLYLMPSDTSPRPAGPRVVHAEPMLPPPMRIFNAWFCTAVLRSVAASFQPSATSGVCKPITQRDYTASLACRHCSTRRNTCNVVSGPWVPVGVI